MNSVVTVGICPCWDIRCYVDGVAWGDHSKILRQDCVVAGKSMNVSRALAWMGVRNVAAGLWGRGDYELMLEEAGRRRDVVDIHLTRADGVTRRNVTVIDTRNGQEMHLRAASELASHESLRTLSNDLQSLVDKATVCVLAGSLPEDELSSDVAGIVKRLSEAGCRIVIDSSQKSLKQIVDSGDIWIAKPNLQELRQLLDDDVNDNTADIVRKARRLNDRAEIVLVSRGPKGAIAIGKDFAVEACCDDDRKVVSTVGCGDYLLAGFVAGAVESVKIDRIENALVCATKAAAAKAWDLCEKMTWPEISGEVEAQVRRVD